MDWARGAAIPLLFVRSGKEAFVSYESSASGKRLRGGCAPSLSCSNAESMRYRISTSTGRKCCSVKQGVDWRCYINSHRIYIFWPIKRHPPTGICTHPTRLWGCSKRGMRRRQWGGHLKSEKCDKGGNCPHMPYTQTSHHPLSGEFRTQNAYWIKTAVGRHEMR